MPTGKMPDFDVVKLDFENISRDFESSEERVLMSLPAPMKPRPPAMETAAARDALAIRRIGAQLMSGLVVHGYAAVREDAIVIEDVLDRLRRDSIDYLSCGYRI